VTVGGIWIVYWICWPPAGRNYKQLLHCYTVTGLHTPDISVTTAHRKFSQSRHFLVMGLNSGDSTASTDNWLFSSDSRTELTNLRVRVTLRLAVYRQSVLAPSPLGLTTRVFQLNNCGHSPCVTSSLPRGCVCRLQLLLVLVSAVILRSEFCGTRDHILLFQIRDSANLERQVPVFISPRNRVARLHPRLLSFHCILNIL
jgi:hypothetical protein